MHNLQPLLEVLVVGMGISAAFYWAAFIWGRLSTSPDDFKWWLKVVLFQGLLLSAALKILKVF